MLGRENNAKAIDSITESSKDKVEGQQHKRSRCVLLISTMSGTCQSAMDLIKYTWLKTNETGGNKLHPKIDT